MKTKFKGRYRIESARLKDWNYGSIGFYFLTLCVKNREYVFGDITDGKMVLSELGNIAKQCWEQIPDHFLFVIWMNLLLCRTICMG